MRVITLSILFWICLSQTGLSENYRLDSLYHALDEATKNYQVYEAKRLARIEVLNNRSTVLDSFSPNLYDINRQLYQEYMQYQCDSAVAFLNKNIVIAEHLKDTDRLHETKLLLASRLELSGFYKESTDLLASIDRNGMPQKYLRDYYYCHTQVYRSLGYHTKDRRQAKAYREKAKSYQDSLFNALEDREDDFTLTLKETSYQDMNRFDEAIGINDIRLSNVEAGTPAHAMITYSRAISYARQGNREMEKYYLALSALSDVKSAIKDYASLWMLAEILFDEGDIDRAYNYIRFSWNDIQFYNARLRSLQTAGILAVIDQTYRMQLHSKNEILRRYTVLVSILVLLLAVALFFIRRQMSKLAVARDELEKVNGQLNELNHELKQANDSLLVSNRNLSESNMIKEKYIGRFINLCSVYIDKLDAYRRMAHKKLRERQIDDLLHITASPESLDNDLKELYLNFDTAFLQLFPNFVKEFNKLLHDGEAIVPKKEELLNTELRIYALIRLGIDDSACIAEFLRYSLNTIYNYRAKVRNKAKVSRDEFENMVKQIR